jgi:two-component system, chemotaxis family, CheB/CheR fusion protein
VATDAGFEELLGYLKEARGFDFTGYKRASLVRRVTHRMNAVGLSDYEEYIDFLQVHPDEFNALFDTILINVTSFFRDAEAWSQLRDKIVPDLVARRGAQGLRVWSAGCASGEEAYSLAIVLAQVMGIETFRRNVKIYATDVDELALAQARTAAYTDKQLRGLSEEEAADFFEQLNGHYVFRKDLRRNVIFGRNDLVQDAPISRIDLLVCRNTLIYLNSETQGHILRRLHFALRPEGILFLGKAEMLLSHARLFSPVDLKRRFFTKVTAEAMPERAMAAGGRLFAEADNAPGNSRLSELAMQHTPLAQVVLDAENRLAVSNRAAESLFGLSDRDAGRPVYELEMSYRPVELRTLVAQAGAERRTVWAHDIAWQRTPSEQLVLDVQVVPLLELDGTTVGFVVTFHDVTRYSRLQDELSHANRQLETAYEELQSTNEELETTNEELQSTVEELETTNEELQSTNEELETMNEELHSMNDELQTSNDELRLRTTEISDLNRFMNSVLTSLRAGIAVLDRDMRILSWNGRAEDLWGLRQEEAVGQHLFSLDIGLPVDELRPLIRTVSDDGSSPDAAEITLGAINRRGKDITIRISGSRLKDTGDGGIGVILVMEQV